FQRFGLVEGFDTNLARDDDGYQRAKLKEIGYPDWNDTTAAPCHNLMPVTGKVVIQYPPGVGLVLALFPPGHQVVPMYMLADLVPVLAGSRVRRRVAGRRDPDHRLSRRQRRQSVRVDLRQQPRCQAAGFFVRGGPGLSRRSAPDLADRHRNCRLDLAVAAGE